MQQVNPEVIILMATYNGAKYIDEQINSILNQTYRNWVLVIRDDNSIDNTVNIIDKYVEQNKNIIKIQSNGKEKGALGNFAALYLWAKENLNPKYIMFSDQDDFWEKGKIAEALILMQKNEVINTAIPLLVYSDLEMFSAAGVRLNKRINVLTDLNFNKILAQNYCFGCTMLLNEPLIKKIDFISNKAENHDYWVALTALAFGQTLFMPNPNIFYRQHDNNVSSQGNSLKKRYSRYTKGLGKRVEDLRKTLIMLNDFYNTYQSKLSDDKKNILATYVKSFDNGFLSVVKCILTYKILRINILQNFAFLFTINRLCRKLNV